MTRSTWRRIRVADLVASGDAEVKTGPFGTQLHASDYVESGTPVINVRNIGFGGIRADKLEYIADDTVRRLSGHLLHPGDIVFGRKGAVERHVLIRDRQSKWFQGSDCLRLRLRTKRVLPQFLSYYLLTRDHQTWMMQQCSHGATMASLNQDIVGRIEFSAPDPAGQESVTSILSAYDDLIENNTRRIAILEEMARRIYEEWFIRFRFPGHQGVRMVESALGLVPEGWTIKAVEDVTETLGGGTPSKTESDYWDGGEINWYSPTDLTGARTLFMEESASKITTQGLAKSSAKLFPANSVMMTSRATLGVIAVNTTPACTNQGFIVCVPSDRMPLWLLFHWLKANESEFEALATGATFKEITKGVFREVKVAVPAKPTATAFEGVVGPMMDLVLRLERNNRNLRTTRDLLLPKLMSGELDMSALRESEALAA